MSNHQSNATRRWAFKADERTILCCSSTRHRRFTDDLVKVMSLPSGSRVRLRYGVEVCDPDVREMGERAAAPPMRALIAHVGFNGTATEYLPLRMGTVVELRTVGSVTFLEIKLGDFVEAPTGTSFGDLLAQVARLQLPACAPGEDKPKGFFCQILPSPMALSCGRETGLWERVGKNFLTAISDTHAAFPFIFHASIVHKRSGKPVSLRDGMLIAPAISQIEIHIRTLSTQSSFDSIIQAPVGTLTLTIDHPDARLTSGAQHAIDTTRNLLLSRLATNISLRPAYGSLTLTARRCPPKATTSSTATEEAATIPPPRPEPVDEVTVEVPVAVGQPWSRMLAIVFISAALAMHAFDIGELKEHADYVWWKTVAVFGAACVALFMGLKPQSGN